MPVKFYNQGTNFRLRQKNAIRSWIEQSIALQGFSIGDISYIFCDPETHIGINRQYLGHDYHTDVITFDYTDYDAKIIGGDIFIDPITVKSNAREYGYTFREEMLRVLVHGVLHLCGHKDKTEQEQLDMRAKEDKCLSLWKNQVILLPLAGSGTVSL